MVEGRKLIKRHLSRYVKAAMRELDRFHGKCKKNSNRMDNLKGKLKFKPFFKELLKDHKEKEVNIDLKMERAFAKQQKTYLYGLGLKVKVLQKDDDPLAVDLIKAEIQKVKANPQYFKDLMLEAHNK